MIRLSVDYKDVKLYYENSDWQKGAYEMFSVVDHISHILLGIDVDAIFELISKGTFKPKSLYETSPSAKEYKPLVNSLISEYYFTERFDVFKSSPTVLNTPKFKDKLVFISDDGWVSVKKKSVDNSTTNREVAAFMLGVRASAVSKLAYSNLEESRMKEIEKASKGKRSLSVVLEFLDGFDDPWEFAYAGALVGYPITPTNAILKKVFPELKLPGIRGRRAGPSRVL